MRAGSRRPDNPNTHSNISYVAFEQGIVSWVHFLCYKRKICFKDKVTKALKMSKHADLSNGGLFSKSLVPFFRKTYALPVSREMKRLRDSVFQC